MRAAVRTTFGGPEVVSLQDVPPAQMGDGDIRIRVVASSVNRTDCGARSGTPAIARLFFGLRAKQSILGCEFAGRVIEVGPDVAEFRAGDDVFGFDDAGFGGHGEELVISALGAVAHIPDGIDFATAAAGPEGAHYALGYLDSLGLGDGQSVFVYGATGAIGSAAVQLAAERGCRVTAVADTDTIDLVRGLGADTVIDRLTEDFTADPGGHDLVFDAVGKTSYTACRHLLTRDGWWAATEFGPRFQNLWQPMLSKVGVRPRAAFPVPHPARPHVKRIAAMLAAGTFRPVVDRTYDLDDIVEAYRFVETGTKVGNVQLRITDPADLA